MGGWLYNDLPLSDALAKVKSESDAMMKGYNIKVPGGLSVGEVALKTL